MKRFLPIGIFISFVPFLLSSQSFQSPYWKAGVGPYGGNVSVLETSNSELYAFHEDGFFYRSMDAGVHWEPFLVQPVDSAAYSESLYVGRSGNFYSIILKQIGNNWVRRLYYSTDQGATWQLRNDQIYLLQVWENMTGTLMGYDGSFNLLRSTNSGLTWQNLGNLNGIMEFYPTVITGSNGRVLISNSTGNIAYSLNDGQTWQTGGDWDPFITTRLDMSASGTLFRMEGELAFNDPLLQRSTDWGQNWQIVNINLAFQEYPGTLMELSTGRLLLTTNLRTFYSDDQGISWNMLIQPPGERGGSFMTKIPLANGDILSFTAGSLYRSSDSGLTWTPSASGMGLAEVKQLVLITDSLQLAMTFNGLWRSADAGNSWTRILVDSIQGGYSYGLHPIAHINADSFVMTMAPDAWRTVDGGAHFQNITPSGKILRELIFTDREGHLFTTDSFGIIRSGDFGATWQHLISGETMLECHQHADGTLFSITAPIYSTSATKVSRSFDGGVSWENVAIPGIQFNLEDIAINNQGDVYANGFGGHSLQLARSGDLGTTWTYSDIPDVYAFGPMAVNRLNQVFTVGGSDFQIFTTADQGNSWYYLPKYIENGSLLNGLEISPSGHLYVMPNNSPVYRTNESTQNGGYIRGGIYRDADADCSTPDAQQALGNWVLEISGNQHYTVTSSGSGQYAVFTPPGSYEVSAYIPQYLWWSACDTTLTVQVDSMQTVDSVDFSIVAASECPLMTVDVGVPQLRRCFDNTVYIAYCNSGSELAEDAWVDVELDPFLTLNSATITFQPLGNNAFRFPLGDIEWGDCGQFSMVVNVDCNAVPGQTHCLLAHAFPDTLCTTVPNWSGATIEANASCQDSMVRLELRNISSDPSSLLDYIIIEDDVVLLHEQKQYDANESIQVEYPANGHTWRIESEQEPGHPFSNLALAFVEGCGGYQSLGYVNQFNVNGWTPSVNRACVENTGSYDPNDKQGFPTGYGEAHRIRPGQALEYLIRFQNTGTDTAFTVEIRDTLSAWLDPASVRPGASSHSYTWHLSGAGILTFRFDNIMLPDSNTNLAGSQGFVSFWINQRPEVPLETQILNTAAIYFDFNDPVITNQTLHTVGLDYLNATHETVTSKWPSIEIQPNPAVHETLLRLPRGTEKVMLFDVLGRVKRTLPVQNLHMRLDRSGLPAGMYWLQATDRKGKITGVGKIVWM